MEIKRVNMSMYNQFTDRELLENIYVLLLQIWNKVKEIDNDEKQFSMNLVANLIGDKIIQK